MIFFLHTDFYSDVYLSLQIKYIYLFKSNHLRAFCWYSRAFLVSAEARVVYSTALSTWASILDLNDQRLHLIKAIIGEVMTQTDKAELMDLPVDNLPLLFNQHGHVHEHLVEFLDRRLQLHEHLMSEEK